MGSLILSLIMLLITLPIKASIVALKAVKFTGKTAKKVKDRLTDNKSGRSTSSEDYKNADNLSDKSSLINGTKKITSVMTKTANLTAKAVKGLIHGLQLLLGICKAVSVVLGILGLIVVMFTAVWFIILVACIAFVVVYYSRIMGVV